MTDASEQHVLAAANSLVDAFARHDATAYFAHFAPHATFIFYTHPTPLNSRAEWEKLWAQWENEAGFRVHSCTSHDQHVQLLTPDVAVFTHLVESAIEMEGQIDTVRERETIVFQLIDGAWLAVHEHLSPLGESDD